LPSSPAAAPLHSKPRGRKKTKNRSKKGKKLKSSSYCNFAVCAGHRRRGREEGSKPLQISPVAWIFLQRCMNPRTASGAWSKHATMFPTVLEVSKTLLS